MARTHDGEAHRRGVTISLPPPNRRGNLKAAQPLRTSASGPLF